MFRRFVPLLLAALVACTSTSGQIEKAGELVVAGKPEEAVPILEAERDKHPA